ncbi:hypothetical protein BS47DRAFT_1212814 [Hydnum rufescens UP504]|uniref:Nickel/cobalt efflux system n=1 Tax=Hydnum rufescens UP504 TaxID=1448309 RepID=A0A9P6AS55_9AGAM|nr:hypothetical protein BS47DRAFT_1212814 [Hydnum rufescens UP504]
MRISGPIYAGLRRCVPRLPGLSLFGRSLILVISEITANVVLWVLASLLFGLRNESRGILSLCLLAWTLGLRHALDADHISAIDNATRTLISFGQLPVTCGLYFSLGHSSIVIVVVRVFYNVVTSLLRALIGGRWEQNVAIAISSDVYGKIGGIGTVGGIVGSTVSASFLFIIGLANSVILWRIIKHRRMEQRRARMGLVPNDEGFQMAPSIMLRLLGPVTTFVDRPWKVGVLFGFGFDTASSIALLAITALAKKDAKGQPMINRGDIIILPLLFTAGMTLIDSADSIVMLYSYSGFPEHGWQLWEKKRPPVILSESTERASAMPSTDVPRNEPGSSSSRAHAPQSQGGGLQIVDSKNVVSGVSGPSYSDDSAMRTEAGAPTTTPDSELERKLVIKHNTMSTLSIALTLISILVAFSISLITAMGIIAENCRTCHEAAEHDPGLSGKWWRAWQRANNNSGIIGAAIVGLFVSILVAFYAGNGPRGDMAAVM